MITKGQTYEEEEDTFTPRPASTVDTADMAAQRLSSARNNAHTKGTGPTHTDIRPRLLAP